MTDDETKTIKQVVDAAEVQHQGISRVLHNEPGLKEAHKEILTDVSIGLAMSHEKLKGLLSPGEKK